MTTFKMIQKTEDQLHTIYVTLLIKEFSEIGGLHRTTPSK